MFDWPDDAQPSPAPEGLFTACRDRAMLALFDAAGLRPAALSALTLQDLDLPARRLWRPASAGLPREWPLPEAACAALQSWLDWRQRLPGGDNPASALFVTRHGQRLSIAAVQQRIRLAGLARVRQAAALARTQALDAEREAPYDRALYAPLDFRQLVQAYRKAHPRARRTTETTPGHPPSEHDDDSP